MKTINLHILPRQSMSREKFLAETPQLSIALDGVVLGGPFYDEATRHANFDHHDGVVREATMSTCKQVYFAIKGSLFQAFQRDGVPAAEVYINDTDQDTTLAVYELEYHIEFEGIKSIPHLNRLIALNDELDITGGSFPRKLDEHLLRQHNWVFEPYTDLRKTGALANASEEVLRDNLEAMLSRINQFMMGQGKEKEIDTRHEILYSSPYGYQIVNEIGGNEARYHLFAKGMNAFISLVATRQDGRKVWTIGRRSQYIPFPVQELYQVYNRAEGLSNEEGWNGSTIIGGSSRKHGSALTAEKLAELTDAHMKEKYGKK